jgi:hypothetical protein
MNYELVSLETADGELYSMQDGTDRIVLSTPGQMGLPPIDYITQKGYKQDGETELGFRLQPRTLSVNFRHDGCSRDEYWQVRSAILDIVRPNRNGQMTFTFVTSEGDKRSLMVRSLNPTFPDIGSEVNFEFGFGEIFSFRAFDPLFFDPTVITGGTADQDITELTFPITFDPGVSITFDTDEAFGAIAVSYSGTWYSYPTFVITGPFTEILITHNEIGASLLYQNSAVVNESLTIDLENVTIEDQDGNDMFGFLNEISNLLDLRLQPHPIVENGNNSIAFSILGSVSNQTTITMTYTNKYLGI